MARKKQNITIIGKAANQRVERAIPKLRQENGFGERQATAVAIRMESVGQLGMGGDAKTAKQRRSGSIGVGAFATSQLLRNRQPKKTITVNTEPIQATSAGDYARQYRTNVPVMFTTNKRKPKKK